MTAMMILLHDRAQHLPVWRLTELQMTWMLRTVDWYLYSDTSANEGPC